MPSASDAPDPATLLRNVLAQLGLRQVDLARRTGLSAKHVNQIAQGRIGISPDIALMFERATGVPALTWLHAQAACEERAVRRRPRVWWSDTAGVIEQLMPPRQPVRYLRVTTNTVLDDLPDDVVELMPDASRRRSQGAAPAQPPPELVDAVKEKLREYRLRFGPNMCEQIKNGAHEVNMHSGEREYLAYAALEAIAVLRAEKRQRPLW